MLASGKISWVKNNIPNEPTDEFWWYYLWILCHWRLHQTSTFQVLTTSNTNMMDVMNAWTCDGADTSAIHVDPEINCAVITLHCQQNMNMHIEFYSYFFSFDFQCSISSNFTDNQRGNIHILYAYIHTYISHFISPNTMAMKVVTGITQTNKAGRQYKAKQTL
jgi:hypothetical protein